MRRKITKDIAIVTLSQLVSLVFSVARSLILPLFLSVVSFGYFQTYLFYTSFTPLLCFGYNDGVYLRYGDFNYEQIPFKRLSNSNFIFLLNLVICSALTILFSIFFVNDKNLLFSLVFTSIYIIINGINTLILQIYQITGNFKKYSVFSIVYKVLAFVSILLLIIYEKINFKYVILSDILSLTIVNIILIFYNKNLFTIDRNFLNGWEEYKINVKSGLPLLIGNILGLLIVGAGRFIIQFEGGIYDFSQYSFGISIASFITITITAVSVVLYPMIKRIELNALADVYNRIDDFLKISVLLIVPFYFVVLFLLHYYYTKYIGIIGYLSILFVIIYIQTITLILQNTYYKVLRMERRLLYENIFSLIILLLLGIPLYRIFKSNLFIAIITLIAVYIRYYLSKKHLKTKLELKNNKNNYPELFLLVVFILATVFCPILLSLFILIPSIIIYLIVRRSLLKSIFLKNNNVL